MFSIKRELKVNNKEKSYLSGCAGYSRFVYNYGLTMIKESWSFAHVKASDSKRLNEIKKIFTNHVKTKPEFSWMNNYSSRIYQNAFMSLNKAFSNWRKGLTSLPKFKKKRHECSFTVDSSNGKVLVKEGKSIKIPTLGTFRLKEAIPFNCISQTFTISQEAGKWYVSFSVDANIIPEMKHNHQRVGIDLGIKTFATLSNGETLITPPSLKPAKLKLSKVQWRNRHKVLGNRKQGIKASNNAIKYYSKLRRKHKYLANIREDFLQKTTTNLAKTYQEIKIEDLNISGMIANHKLAEAISNLGFYRFRELLSYKQEWYGFLLTIVDRWYPSSKTCSFCGHIQNMPLKERIFNCGSCGQIIDRDLNAALKCDSFS